MGPAHFRADNVNLGVRPNHGRYDHSRSPQLSPSPLVLLYGQDSGSSRWQAPRIDVPDTYSTASGGHLKPDGGPLPLFVPIHDTGYDDAPWISLLPSSQHQTSSPRQRFGFPRSNTDVAEPTPSSPALSDSGLTSPSLPILSPYASERSKRTVVRKRMRTRLTAPTLLQSQASWLALYFAFNLGLTLYNKLVLIGFPFPYTLTALHALCGSIGGWVLRRRGAYVPASLAVKHHVILAAFSALYAVNIAVSNASLQLVTVPFHQVVRAATPIFTTSLSMILFGTQFSRTKILTLIPVMAGVALATYGDYYFTLWGLLLTLLGTFLAALKTIYTNVLQSSPSLASVPASTKTETNFSLRSTLSVPPCLALHPLDLLTRTSPLACLLCLLYAHSSGELMHVREAVVHEGVGGWLRILMLLGNGVIAFGLNVVSLSANKRVGALNMTVAANVKQALTILCAVALFHLTITPLNALGICVTLAGGAWYAWVEYLSKMERKREQEKRLLTRLTTSAIS